jgi:hypothetical protein
MYLLLQRKFKNIIQYQARLKNNEYLSDFDFIQKIAGNLLIALSWSQNIPPFFYYCNERSSNKNVTSTYSLYGFHMAKIRAWDIGIKREAILHLQKGFFGDKRFSLHSMDILLH